MHVCVDDGPPGSEMSSVMGRVASRVWTFVTNMYFGRLDPWERPGRHRIKVLCLSCGRKCVALVGDGTLSATKIADAQGRMTSPRAPATSESHFSFR